MKSALKTIDGVRYYQVTIQRHKNDHHWVVSHDLIYSQACEVLDQQKLLVRLGKIWSCRLEQQDAFL